MPGLSLVAMPAVLGMLSIFSVLPFPSLFPFPLFLLRVGFKTLVMDVSLFELSVGQQDLASQILILSIAAAWKNAVHFIEEEVTIRMRPAERSRGTFFPIHGLSSTPGGHSQQSRSPTMS